MEARQMQEPLKIKCCDKCGNVLNNNSWIAVTDNGRVYCYEASCHNNIPANENVVYDGFFSEIFCAKCGEIVSTGRRKPDVSGKVFCCEGHERFFYENTRRCTKCGCELR